MQIQIQRTVEGRARTVGDVRQWLTIVSSLPQVHDGLELMEETDLSVTFDDILIPEAKRDDDYTEAAIERSEGMPEHYDHGIFGSGETTVLVESET